MKILLITPTFQYTRTNPDFLSLSDFPTGFAYIAASLKKAGHEVHGLNPNNRKGYGNLRTMVASVVRERVTDIQPDLIGLGGLCTDYAFLRDAIKIIREIDDSIPIVLGGLIVTNDHEIFDILKPDYAITGEADNAIVELANGLENGGVSKGLIEAEAPDVNNLPLPDYEPFDIQDMMDNHSIDTRLLYRYSRLYPRPFNIVASRSCPFTCTFCIHRAGRDKYRARLIEDVLEEIRISYEKYDFNILIILDELFAVNKKRMRELCEGIIEGKKKHGWDFDFTFQTHASAKFDVEEFKLAKEAGCFFFSYGLESASPDVLKSMNKKIKLEQVKEAMDMAREVGVGFGGNLIFGDIAETEETIAESLTFWFENCQDNFVFMDDLCAYPGSQLFEDANVMGRFQNKKEYYESIDKAYINVSQVPNHIVEKTRELYKYLDSQWLFTKSATDTHVESEGNGLSKIWGTCPYCGKESMYRTQTPDPNALYWVGLGCTHCNRKIKVGSPL